MYINGIGVINKKNIAKIINIDALDYRDDKKDRLYKLRRDTDENYIYSE